MKQNYHKKNRRWLNLGFIAVLALTLFACKKDKNSDTTVTATTQETNQWILDSMKTYYYWSASLPAKPNLNQEVPDFFESIRNSADRFSWVQKTEELEKNLSGITKEAGFDFYLLAKSETSNDVVGLIRIITENSPASKAGLARGTYFTRVNGTTITRSNYQTVVGALYSGNPFTLTTAAVENGALVEKQTINLTPLEIQENPIHAATVLTTTRTGKKVGYLFYNQFLDEYNDALVNAFKMFKSNNVSTVILDFRYNPGGSIAAAALMASLVQPNFTGNEDFIQFQGNSNLGTETYKYSDIFSAAAINAIKSANLNLSNVYVLATGSSASASELVINNLRPFTNVIHIGETTVGKNEASITIKDQRKPVRVEWAIQPIVFRTANKNGFGDYATGLTPAGGDIIDELDYALSPLGSASDPLIARALEKIDPGPAITAARTPSIFGAKLKGLPSRKAQVMTVDKIKLK